MCALPIVPGSEVSTPEAGTRIDGAAFRQAALAPGRLAGAIGEDAGNLFHGVANNIAKARNAKMVFDADLTMRKTKDDFLASLTTNPELASDPGKWMPAYQQRVQQVSDQVLNQPNLSPVAKRQLTQMTAGWAQASSADIRVAALNREVSDTKRAGMATATKAAQDGQEDVAVAAYKSLNEIGAMGPKETAARIKQVPAIAAESKANTAIATSPIEAPKVIESQLQGKMDPKRYRVVLSVAKEAQAKAQAENAQDLSGRIDDSPDHTIDPKLLQGWKDAGKIRDSDFERLQNRMKVYKDTDERERNKAETSSFNVAMMEAQNHHWADDDKIQDSATEMKGAGLEWKKQALRRRLNSFVDEQVKSAQKKGESEEKPVERIIYQQMNEDREKNGLTLPMVATPGQTHWFGSDTPTSFAHVDGGLTALRKMSDDEIKEKFGEKATKESVLRDEQQHYANQQAKMRDWFKANPEATEEQAQQYRQKLEKPFVSAAISQILKKSMPVAVHSKEDFEALPSGAAFIWNGRTGTVP